MTTVLPPLASGLDDLIPAARDLVARLGQIPSRNRLMKELRIGAPRATALRELLETPADPWEYSGPVEGAPGLPAGLPEPATILPAAEQQPGNQGGHPGSPGSARIRPVPAWPIILLALPAFVAVWSGWVGLGRMTGFGMVDLLPGIVESGGWATIDSAITLPVGVETYAAYALWVWLSGRMPDRARRFARVSALGSLAVGAFGQVAYHLLAASGVTSAPWQITTAVACLPVAVLGMGAALRHLVHAEEAS